MTIVCSLITVGFNSLTGRIGHKTIFVTKREAKPSTVGPLEIHGDSRRLASFSSRVPLGESDAINCKLTPAKCKLTNQQPRVPGGAVEDEQNDRVGLPPERGQVQTSICVTLQGSV